MVCSLMYQADEIIKNNESLNIRADFINSKLNEQDQLNKEILDYVLEDIIDFIFNYLFKGEVSSLGFKFETLFGLEGNDLETLKAVHFLLNDKLRTFLYNLPILLRNLSHSTQKENKEFKGIIRGRIDWNDTIKTRYAKGFYDPSLFICSPPSKYYDLEENQLLKYMLKKILKLINQLSFLTINKNESFKGFDLETIADEKDWYKIIQNNYTLVKKTLKKVYFDKISDVRYIKPKMIRKANKNRNHLYHLLADIYKLYNDLFENKDEAILKELLNEKVIKAADHHKLYEIYIFYKLVDALPEKPKLGLMHKSNEYAAELEKDDGSKITIHYQHTPYPLSSKDISEYLRIIDNYIIGGKSRAPDIILEFEKDNKRTFRIVEVKNTSDTGYIRDSIYKVMGYYKDFERILDIENSSYCLNCPIVLVTWGGIRIKKDYNPFHDNIIVLNRKEFLNNLDNLINLD